MKSKKAKKTPKPKKIDDTQLTVRCYFCLEKLARYTAGGQDSPRWMHWYKRPQLDTWGSFGYGCGAPERTTEDLVIHGNRAWTSPKEHVEAYLRRDLERYHNR